MANFDDVFEAPDNGKMTWEEAVKFLTPYVHEAAMRQNHGEHTDGIKIFKAWSTILRGV